MAKQYRSYLEEEMSKQVMVVRGMDRERHAIVIKMPRESSETNDEAFITAQLYIAERVIAATELLSEGKKEKVLAIFEFGTYSSSNAPPFRVMRGMATMLQRNYPERLSHLCVLDPPFFMRAIFNLIHPFLSADTKEKVFMLSSAVSACPLLCGSILAFFRDVSLTKKIESYDTKASKQEKLGSLVSNDQAMPFMIPEGKLTTEIDTKHFLQNVPFNRLYDDENADR